MFGSSTENHSIRIHKQFLFNIMSVRFIIRCRRLLYIFKSKKDTQKNYPTSLRFGFVWLVDMEPYDRWTYQRIENVDVELLLLFVELFVAVR